ncbi:kinase-like domain-containing protein [Daldinia decipiens]|uniref:kinase-like domain-containing protein n=1 Tax=Daldinia decipiens TaxID=326647 RepID=UPI0020C46491|nr:kinase-like domain-containing protein [Daldinia decipiens]KAI1658351.1 kinase-like domain-containing protein [Daldinia decipiens]
MKPFQRLYQPAVEDTGEVEDRERYRPGGYHPIHFNDNLGHNERFNVIHKLGWGVSSTVWLCFDKESGYYRSVKVMTADESAEDCPELRIMKALGGISHQELQDNHIIIPHEYFWIQGPNGRHLCLVSDLLGPSLFRNSPLGTGLHTPEILTNLTYQVSKGLQYLHKKGICHGDLRPSNILMQLHQYSLMELPDSRLYRYLGPRECETLYPRNENTASHHGPRYLALPASLDKLETKCRTSQVALVDFAHSFYNSSLTRPSRWHRQYAGPELLFTKTPSGFPQDIWGLACTIYEVKLQTQLFSEYEDYSSLIRQMESWFGPLPVEYRQTASAHLERDRKQHLISSSGKQPSSNKTSISEDRLSDLDQLLSLSPDEEKRARDLFTEGTSWSNPLQAALGEEQICYIYERNDADYTSSDNTDTDFSSSDAVGRDWSSEDEGSHVDTNTQLEIDIQGIENQDLVSEDSDERNEESNSPSLPIPNIFVDLIGQSRDEQGFPEKVPQVETKEASQELQSNENDNNQTKTPSSPKESLGKENTSEDRQEREAKRQRTDKNSAEKGGELVKRVVRMPRAEVLLLSDLLMNMFKHDPKERIDIDAVVNHEYWGDKRNHWPVKNEDLGEGIPDPISSRTRSRASKPQQQAEPGSP